MAGFFKKVFSGDSGNRQDVQSKKGSASDKKTLLQMTKLTEIFRYFSLGEKIEYYPEYQKEGSLETIILGYGVNDLFVYSPIDIRYTQEGSGEALLINANGEQQTIREVESFSIIIPFNQEDENKRDYVRRAELGPRGPFRRHNTITLVSCSRGGTLSQIDTVVKKVQSLESGIYAGHDVVLLDIIPNSLQLTDQRQHYRLQTNLPAKLTIKDGGAYDCTLIDFSEESVQLQFKETNVELDALTEFRHITLTINTSVGHQSKEFVLDGVMFRKTGASLVMKLHGIYKDGNLETLGLVDILDIKASLLHHPDTTGAHVQRV